MAKVIVKDNHINLNGVAYFCGHAEEVELGSYGEKRAPLTKMNYLDVKGMIPVPRSAKVLSTVVEIDSIQSSRSAFSTDVSAIVKGVPVQLSGKAAFEQIKKKELKLVKLSVPVGVIKAAVKGSRSVRADLIHYGKDARIALEVIKVIEATMAEKFNHNASVELTLGEGGMEVTSGGRHSSSGGTTVSFSKKTTLAYALAKIEWNARQDKNKTEIVDLDLDQWSFS